MTLKQVGRRYPWPVTVTQDGKSVTMVRELCIGKISAMEGLDPRAVKRRVLKGMDIKAAVEDARRFRESKRPYNIEFEGRRWDVEELACHLGISSKTLYKKLRAARVSGATEFTVRVREGSDETD